ncbi:MAG: hypothetical protein LQ339_000543 [Xanthoria mediterranea]|nr:MAG: hypothetical protein LQ339_000543 [Xanthoria mediterranea]
MRHSHTLRILADLSKCTKGVHPGAQWQWQQRRQIHISAPSASTNEPLLTEPIQSSDNTSPDAKFEISDSPLPLLHVSLSASQNLHTRRGTLVGLGGKPDNVVSTLSILEPFRRLIGGIPFLYQRISSTSPITALISPKPSISSLAVVHLDGSTDWMVIGRSLLAWTGQTLSVRPTISPKLSLAHWGSSEITGRGLFAIAGNGSIAQIVLDSGENYIAHPSNVVGYSMNRYPPLPYRLKASSFRLQIPDLGLPTLLPDTKFFRVMRESRTWIAVTRIAHSLRTWFRRSIWGDRLFLQFHGPATILLQTRAVRLNDVLTSREVNEIAEAPGGSVPKSSPLVADIPDADISKDVTKPLRMSTASLGPDGKIIFEKDQPSSAR